MLKVPSLVRFLIVRGHIRVEHQNIFFNIKESLDAFLILLVYKKKKV